MRLFSDSEIRFNGCRPIGPPDGRERNGEPLYDLGNIRPTNPQGDSWLRDIHREYDNQMRHDAMRRAQPYGDPKHKFTEGHIGDAMRYMAADFIPQQEELQMSQHQQLAEALLDNFYTVILDKNGYKRTYKVHKDLKIEKDDIVVALQHNGTYMAQQVLKVHDGVKNPDNIRLAWVIHKVDVTVGEQLVGIDNKAIEKIKEMETRKAKRELLAEFSEDEQKLLSSELHIDV